MKSKETTLEYLQEQTQNIESNHISAKPDGMAPGEIIIGVLTGLDKQGNALVEFSGNVLATPVPAVSTVALNHQHAGRQVALLFNQGNPEKPVIMGLIHSPLQELIESFEIAATGEASTEMKTSDDQHADNKENDVYLDGQRLVLEGKKEIVLKCGDSSITLTKAGKILIRGKYLLNRSAGVNRILGGSVQIN